MPRLFVALFFAITLFASSVYAFTIPTKPAGYINDYAHVLSIETAQSLEAELSAFDATTTNQIAVAIVPDMDSDYIEHYAVKLFESWGIGTAKHDNGVLLVIAVAEHKLRIEVGYGLEGALPDSLAQHILDTEMTPLLKQGDYDSAVKNAVHAIEAATQGEYTGTSSTSNSGAGLISWLLADGWVLLFVGSFILQWLASILGRTKSWWAGGVVGALGGVSIGYAIGFAVLTTAGIALIFTVIGLIFDYLVSSTYQSHSVSGMTPPWWIGGNTIGGGSSGGGFGGFGGGGSGGGGASGGW